MVIGLILAVVAVFLAHESKGLLVGESPEEYGDPNGDGYVENASTSGKGSINHGWKDSSDAIIDTELRRSPGGAPVASGQCPR